MIPLPNTRANTHLIHAQALNCNEFFIMFEEFCFHGRIGHEEEHDNGECDRDASAEQENDLVRV